MKSLPLLLALSLFPCLARAETNWMYCLDQVKFEFSVGSLLDMTTVAKESCRLRFHYSGGRGERYEVDLCDPYIHVKHYPTLDATVPVKVEAGQAGCPKPMFGANFDENAAELQRFETVKAKLLETYAQVKKNYGANADKVDLSNPRSFSNSVSDGKVACGQYLLQEYLERCVAFEAPKAPVVKGPNDKAPSGIPGVHPATIVTPKN